MQPVSTPPNCHFKVADVEDEWLWESKFDFIYGRYITPYLGDLPKFAKNCYDNLKPGGYIELLEATMLFQAVDASYEGTAMQRWNFLMLEGEVLLAKLLDSKSILLGLVLTVEKASRRSAVILCHPCGLVPYLRRLAS